MLVLLRKPRPFRLTPFVVKQAARKARILRVGPEPGVAERVARRKPDKRGVARSLERVATRRRCATPSSAASASRGARRPFRRPVRSSLDKEPVLRRGAVALPILSIGRRRLGTTWLLARTGTAVASLSVRVAVGATATPRLP